MTIMYTDIVDAMKYAQAEGMDVAYIELTTDTMEEFMKDDKMINAKAPESIDESSVGQTIGVDVREGARNELVTESGARFVIEDNE